MKTLTQTLTFLCLLCSFSSFAQSDTTKAGKTFRPIEERKNEIKLGAVKMIAGPILDIEYERILTPYSSLGGNVVADLGENNYLYNFSLTPYYRMYFTQNKEYGTKGFFAQAFMGYYTGDYTEYNYNYTAYLFNTGEKKWNSFGAGLSVGSKWINKQGFVFQLVFGIGRNFTNKDYIDNIIFQGDAYIGYRF